MICIYHNDMDGKCAAAVVHYAHQDKEITFIDANYNRPFPWKEVKDQDVVIVDFSIQPYEDMKKLKECTKSLVWIDHHKSAIEYAEKADFNIDGIQEAHKGAGCELTWEYYFKNKEIPIAIEYIGDYDTWKFAFGEKTKRFNSGLYIQDTNPLSKFWYFLFNDMRDERLIRTIMRDGDTINLYNTQRYESCVKHSTYEIELCGYKGLACNYYQSGSLLFKSIPDLYEKYQFVCVYYYNGKIWTASVYTERKDVDVSLIATHYGGGGHFGAGGFQCKELPF